MHGTKRRKLTFASKENSYRNVFLLEGHSVIKQEWISSGDCTRKVKLDDRVSDQLPALLLSLPSLTLRKPLEEKMVIFSLGSQFLELSH